MGTQKIEVFRNDLLAFRLQMSEYPGHVNDIVENDGGRHQIVIPIFGAASVVHQARFQL
jgi:hypothetical protein